MNFDIGAHTILKVKHGSHAYGLNIEGSDLDVKGVCIEPLAYHYGFLHRFEQHIEEASKGYPQDLTIYSLKKFGRMAAESNPNIIEVLFGADEDVLVSDSFGEELRDYAPKFLSMKAKHTFSGYAFSQIQRIKSHRQWLLHPPKEPPTRKAYGLSDEVTMSKTEMGAYEALEKKGDEKSVPESIFALYQKERSWRNMVMQWSQYQKWKTERNPARAELEAKFGYDCHLDDTEFLTDSGFKLYDDITESDLLGTLNQATGHIEFQAYSDRVEKPYTGDIVYVSPRNSSCAVTPNHRMWVSPCKRNTKTGFSTAYAKAQSEWQIATAQDLLSGRKSFFHVRVSGTPRDQELDGVSDDFLTLMGCFVSEGCIGKRLSSGTASVIRISQKEGGRICPLMDVLWKKYPETIHRYSYARNNRNVPCQEVIWTVSNREWARKLELECGKESTVKTLPLWTTALNHRQATLLLDAMIAGDGTNKPHSRVYYTSSKLLADAVQMMCLCAGIASQVWGPYQYDRDPDDRFGNRPMYQVYIGKQLEAVTVSFSSSKQSCVEVLPVTSARIVCFTVPNEILVTRRQGSIAIQGNTKHGMHLIRLMRMCKEILQTGKVLVKRDDRDELLAIRFGFWEYEKLLAESKSLEQQCDALYLTSKVLPHAPDLVEIDKFVVDLTSRYLKVNR